MRTYRTRVRRAAPPRRRRPARPRGRARVRHQPTRRRTTSTRRRATTRRRPSRAPQPSMGKSLKTAALAGAAAAALLAGAAYAFTGIHLRLTGTTGPIPVVTESTDPAGPAASQLVYTDRTANDAPVTLPAVVQDNLLSLGLAHRSVELTRIGYTGAVTNSSIDLTPRTGSSSRDPVLKVRDRAVPVIDAKISGIGTAINTPRGSAGGRALYTGLTRTDFTGVPSFSTTSNSALVIGRSSLIRSVRTIAERRIRTNRVGSSFFSIADIVSR